MVHLLCAGACFQDPVHRLKARGRLRALDLPPFTRLPRPSLARCRQGSSLLRQALHGICVRCLLLLLHANALRLHVLPIVLRLLLVCQPC